MEQRPIDSEMVKALILIGMFQGDIPRSHNEYRCFNISDEMIHRLGDLTDIDIVLHHDPQRMVLQLSAIKRVKSVEKRRELNKTARKELGGK
jgi:hypothetical protein